MSVSGNIAIKILRLIHPGKGSFKNIEKSWKKAEKENAKASFSMPKNRKAVFKLCENTEYPCLIIRSKKSDVRNDTKAIMFIYGGITRCWKVQLSFALEYANHTGLDVWYPIYPAATEVSIIKSLSVLYDIYNTMSKQYGCSKVAVVGASFGGNLALGLIDHINRNGKQIDMPGILIAHSPGGIPDSENDMKLFKKYENADPFFSVSDIEMIQQLTSDEEEYPNYFIKPIYCNFKNAPPTYIYYGEEVFAGNAAIYQRAFERDGSAYNIHISIEDNMMHCYSCLPVFPESKKSFFETIDLISKL